MRKTPRFSPQRLAKKHERFAALYKNLALPLTKFLVKHSGGDQEAAEEVFSQTIVAAWKGWHTFEHRSSYFTWLCRIGLNKIADYYKDQVNIRSKFVFPTLSAWANIEDKSLSLEEKTALDELRESVRECLELLPEEKRKLLYLRFWQEMTVKGMAEVLGISERATEGKLYRAKLALREVLQVRNPEIISSY
ncbi:MAG: RNA polymerase, sigma-24 subunit, ECF subfamily [Candidatus Daviesbacteria bacterium GW2011_GWA1_41_61]|uniref:RNA polymerase, sigma-24 subunit, ECF subfamily n=1 Tax=Candidatus Daviesbacteria bacterium GW2011_GWA2_40_9 TaxID=1618424 RepID=A0A0G0X7W3_9BACT|nr:MAG: RNA polymerase, sigma-24 subunit, ECF subfamily [Candidatus Daviesbacteria bacterium GW2011_GWA2_40_9]KKR93673.1 MAG: RNA polymerase, sigma-24 subunit, ECF subfamily [Candidatus Daviesbacteria bacterium GW2011_GWB1_41_15]KKS15139.1 MAG: RNA polymerase, sigma-24 subunit, ECF subfamily [Candidatus Daviesbacteria bacterium GW2011_GWA1_41_61]